MDDGVFFISMRSSFYRCPNIMLQFMISKFVSMVLEIPSLIP